MIATAIQEGLFSVTSESMCTKFLVRLAPEKVWLGQIKNKYVSGNGSSNFR